ncbi:hypothetical protein [Gordonia sp. OPL2]|uniref:hypothetical protein n=1 Tax=Gordonia sp. OPL2 TaxID=2486274 RepID=UPI00165669CA|nr:hypothetical protein [Gordonia sp. OPL2]ROZ85975.1 hypothetical protein EEB19_24370 [Gordonia sp. OPL2]
MSNERTAGHTNRLLTVLVDHIAIEDGQIEPPEVGAVAAFPLRFQEMPSSEPDVVTVRGDLEPDRRPVTQLRDGPMWSGLLRGDGWTATWDGRRPRTGRVEVTGQFLGVMGIDANGWVRGRVTSVQVVTIFWKRVDTKWRWEPIDGRREYRTVERSPHFFTDERMFTDNPPPVSRRDIGVLITMDLDDVAELPLRPPLVAGDLSAGGTSVWVLDRQLPTVTRFGDDGIPTVHHLPGPVTVDRRVWGTPTGCWVSGADGTYRVGLDDEIGERVSTTGGRCGAVVGDRFLVCSTNGPWRIHTADAEVVDIDRPTGSPEGAVADGDSFVVLCSRRIGDSYSYWLIRIAVNGTIETGPALALPDKPHPSGPTLLPGPLTIARDDTFTEVTAGLALAESRRVPRKFLRAGVVGDYFWTVGHPPDRTSRSWWPLQGPTAFDRSRGQFWLLTILERSSLAPVHTAAVLAPQPEVAEGSAETIWLTAAGEVQMIRSLGGTMVWPEPAPQPED